MVIRNSLLEGSSLIWVLFSLSSFSVSTTGLHPSSPAFLHQYLTLSV
uniref:Uncharacterized protein n=1 Tax=Anguilla anguilla TaxID=7936 RepID=A0A0E9XWT1_ANGAN